MKDIKINKKYLHAIRKYIRLNWEEKAYYLLRDKNMYFSKRDMFKILEHMKNVKIFHLSILKYIYFESVYRQDEELYSEQNKSILQVACSSGDLEIIKTFLEMCCEKYEDIEYSYIDSLIEKLCIGGKIDAVKFLLFSNFTEKKYPSFDFEITYGSVIETAASSNNIEIVRFLLSDDLREKYPNINPGENENYALIRACNKGYIEIVKLLLKSSKTFPSIDPADQSNSAIIDASLHGHSDIVKLLLSDEIKSLYPKINPSAQENKAIRYAIEKGQTDTVKTLLSYKDIYPSIDPFCRNKDNISYKVIRTACFRCDIDTVKILLDYGDNIHAFCSLRSDKSNDIFADPDKKILKQKDEKIHWEILDAVSEMIRSWLNINDKYLEILKLLINKIPRKEIQHILNKIMKRFYESARGYDGCNIKIINLLKSEGFNIPERK